MRLGAQPFLWKWFLFAWELKMISISKAEHLPSFWNRGSGKLGNGVLKCCTFVSGVSLLLERSKGVCIVCICIFLYMAQFFWHILLSNHVENQANQECTKCYHLKPHRDNSPHWKLESGQFGNRVSLVICSASLKVSLSENLQRTFLLIGGGNPEESERCPPVIFTVSLGILIAW